MTSLDTSAPDSSSPSLTARVPGQAVMSQALRIHDGEPARSWLQRCFGASPLSEHSSSWFQGALGEIAVGRILDRLGPEWTVLHAVPVGSGTSDIDHVLIGPPGVFTLNTKNHAGKNVWLGEHVILVGGQKQRHLSHARHEASRAEKLLTAAVGKPVPVTPVVVLVAPKKLTIKQRPSGVVVLTDRGLLRWLRRRRPVLTEDQVGRITAVAVRPTTWHRNLPLPDAEPAKLHERFAVLENSVRSARRIRGAWGLGLLAGGGAAVVNYVPDVLRGLVTAGLS